MRLVKVTAVLVCTITLSGCATTIRDGQIQTALSLSKDHFRSSTTIKDDSLDTTAKISSVNGFQEKRGLLGIVWDDNFLRAFVDKKTGRTTFQIYQVIYYQGSGWNFYQTVNFETPSGPESRPVTVIKRDVDCTGSRYGGCTHVEHLGFDVDERLLRTISANYQPGQPNAWRFKFSAKSGSEYKDGMLPAEVAGFLEAVDGYRESRGLKTTAVASPLRNEPSEAGTEITRVIQLLKDQGFPIVGDPVRFKQKGNLNYYEARGPKSQVTQVVCESGGACRLRTIND